MDFSLNELILLCVLAICTGMNKTGLPGLGIVVVVLLPMIMPAKISTGYLLPLLIFGDIIAVSYWRNKAIWHIVLRLSPYVIVGIIAGFFLMRTIPDENYGRIFGIIVIVLFGGDLIRRFFHFNLPDRNIFIVAGLGFLAGLMTMMINAAGPVMIIYLLSMKISKERFIATAAWAFFIFNLIKIPFSYAQGLITLQSLSLNLKFLPFVLIGGILGIFFMNKIPPKAFNIAVWLLAFIGGIKLFF
jgi:uncharacterized membrane protein YfcA